MFHAGNCGRFFRLLLLYDDFFHADNVVQTIFPIFDAFMLDSLFCSVLLFINFCVSCVVPLRLIVPNRIVSIIKTYKSTRKKKHGGEDSLLMNIVYYSNVVLLLVLHISIDISPL